MNNVIYQINLNPVTPPEFIPPVSVEALKRAYQFYKDGESVPREGGRLDLSVLKELANPGSDVHMAWYRLTWFVFLKKWIKSGHDDPWICNAEPDEAVFKAVATIPMRTADMQKGLFDIEELKRMLSELS